MKKDSDKKVEVSRIPKVKEPKGGVSSKNDNTFAQKVEEANKSGEADNRRQRRIDQQR